MKFSQGLIIVLHLFITVSIVFGDRILIVPSTNSSCPGEITGEPCLTIQQYVSNLSPSRNTTLELQPGIHNAGTQLSVSNIVSFTMHGNGEVTFNCRQQFIFRHVDIIHLSGITFVNCGGHGANADLVGSFIFENCTFESRFTLHVTRATRATIVNSTFTGGSFVALSLSQTPTLMVKGSTFSDRIGQFAGAIQISQSTVTIEQSVFKNNRGRSGSITINDGHGIRSRLRVIGCTFINNTFMNSIGVNKRGGGAITMSNGNIVVSGSRFVGNTAPIGGAIYVSGVRGFNLILISNSTFMNNRARISGGAIYSDRDQTTITIRNSTFNHNSASACGALDVQGVNHRTMTFDASTFIYNSATSSGGVMCIRDALIFMENSNFSHNYAGRAAGVLRVRNSTVNIVGSTFDNNAAEGDGGVLASTFHQIRVLVNHSSFINNRAGDDGGAMYVSILGSHVKISTSTASFNEAVRRGGVIFIAGSSLEVNQTNFINNSADLGEVISACNSEVILSDQLSSTIDPVQEVCTHYDGNVNVSETFQAITTTASPQNATDVTTMTPLTIQTDASVTVTAIATIQTERSTTSQTTDTTTQNEANTMATTREVITVTMATQSETEITTTEYIGSNPEAVTTAVTGVTVGMAPQTVTSTEVTLMELVTTTEAQTAPSTTDSQTQASTTATVAVRTTDIETEASTTDPHTEQTTTDTPSEAITTDAHTEVGTTNIQTELSTTDPHTEPTTTDTQSEAITMDDRTEAGTTDADTESTTTEIPSEAGTTDTHIETVDIETDASTETSSTAPHTKALTTAGVATSAAQTEASLGTTMATHTDIEASTTPHQTVKSTTTGLPTPDITIVEQETIINGGVALNSMFLITVISALVFIIV